LSVHRKTRRLLEGLSGLGIYTPNVSGLPIVHVPLSSPESLDEVGRHLFDRGFFAAMVTYPLVPQGEAGLRVQVTAATPDEQVDRLIEVLGEVAGRLGTSDRKGRLHLIGRD
jgi:8-amino-7-oxononanoate synthase